VTGVARAVAVVLLAVALAGCVTVHDVLVGPSWSLVEVHGDRPVAEGGVSFAGDGTFTARTGCNTLGGRYHLEANRILIDSEQSTMMPCDASTGAQEAAVLAVLHDRPTYAIDTGTGRLRLTSDAGQVLVFEPG
jgi:heat shock protein HslJ